MKPEYESVAKKVVSSPAEWKDVTFLKATIVRLRPTPPHDLKYKVVTLDNYNFRPYVRKENGWLSFSPCEYRWEVMPRFVEGCWYAEWQCLQAILQDIAPTYFDREEPLNEYYL